MSRSSYAATAILSAAATAATLMLLPVKSALEPPAAPVILKTIPTDSIELPKREPVPVTTTDAFDQAAGTKKFFWLNQARRSMARIAVGTGRDGTIGSGAVLAWRKDGAAILGFSFHQLVAGAPITAQFAPVETQPFSAAVPVKLIATDANLDLVFGVVAARDLGTIAIRPVSWAGTDATPRFALGFTGGHGLDAVPLTGPLRYAPVMTVERDDGAHAPYLQTEYCNLQVAGTGWRAQSGGAGFNPQGQFTGTLRSASIEDDRTDFLWLEAEKAAFVSHFPEEAKALGLTARLDVKAWPECRWGAPAYTDPEDAALRDRRTGPDLAPPAEAPSPALPKSRHSQPRHLRP